MSTAAKVRIEKTNYPSRFCDSPACLWRVETRDGVKPCPKHTPPPPTAAYYKMSGSALMPWKARRAAPITQEIGE